MLWGRPCGQLALPEHRRNRYMVAHFGSMRLPVLAFRSHSEALLTHSPQPKCENRRVSRLDKMRAGHEKRPPSPLPSLLHPTSRCHLGARF